MLLADKQSFGNFIVEDMAQLKMLFATSGQGEKITIAGTYRNCPGPWGIGGGWGARMWLVPRGGPTRASYRREVGYLVFVSSETVRD